VTTGYIKADRVPFDRRLCPVRASCRRQHQRRQAKPDADRFDKLAFE
jgi:hypothetical protein